ncbi:hypothetical protein MMPV_003439 [Pyropia vietnamensis]
MGLSRGYVVAILTLLSIVNYADRWSVAGVLNELQRPPASGGFGLSDLQGGLLTSAFVLSYMIFSPVCGFLGDRYSRREIIFVGIAIWSGATLSSSFATEYWQFLAFRAVVGIGEASYATIAPTLVADLYALEERTLALGYYTSSIPIGSALGYIVGGVTSRVAGWRWAFRITPVVGFLLAGVLYLFVAEPPRGTSDAVAQQRGTPVPASPGGSGGDVKLILRSRAFVWSTLGNSTMAFVSGALAQWAPAYLQRVNCGDASGSALTDCESQINFIFGGMAVVTGTMGTLMGAALSKWYGRRNVNADAIVSGLGLIASTPAVFLALHTAPLHANVAWACIFVAELTVSLTWAPTNAILLSVVPPHQRSTASGLSMLATHAMGDSVSPIAVGYVADKLHDGGRGLSRAMALQHALYLVVFWCFAGGLFFFITANHLQADRVTALGGGYGLLDTEGQGGRAGSGGGSSSNGGGGGGSSGGGGDGGAGDDDIRGGIVGSGSPGRQRSPRPLVELGRRGREAAPRNDGRLLGELDDEQSLSLTAPGAIGRTPDGRPRGGGGVGSGGDYRRYEPVGVADEGGTRSRAYDRGGGGMPPRSPDGGAGADRLAPRSPRDVAGRGPGGTPGGVDLL